MALGSVLFSTHAAAAVLWFSYSNVDTGDTPTSSAPWLYAKFDDADPLGVQLTLYASLESSSEFISTVKFNLSTPLNGALLTFSNSSATGASLPTTTATNNGIVGQGLIFDFEFDFQTAAGSGRFDGTDEFTTLILYGPNGIGGSLSIGDFDVLSGAQGQNTPRYSLAHVQGIPAPGDSGWVYALQTDSGPPDGGGPPTGVPEPGTLLLLGGALAALGLRRRYRR